jgi:hypothetical protein
VIASVVNVMKTRVLFPILVVGIALTGCSGFGSEGVGDAAPVASAWSCVYDPTYDEDWHNDVVCNNGVSSERPYLLPDDDFITEDEIMVAAVQHEAELNGAQ